MQILVIEDESEVRYNILEILNSGGFHSVGVENGYLGIQLAKEKVPDLILCDIRMPELDGYGVLEELRHDPATALIPFIFLTAKTDKADIRQGMNLGADDYLMKPFRRVDLLDTISARLRRHTALLDMQQRIQKLQEQYATKNDLVYAVSHDLRTPLTTIKIALQLLEVTQESVDRKYYFEAATSACDQGEELINNLLDLHHLEDDHCCIDLKPTDTQTHIAKVIELIQLRVCDRQQRLTIDIPSLLPLVFTDSISLKRILAELLNNACKYTPSGGEIQIQVQPGVAVTGEPVVVFTVRNQAEIPVNELPRIFEKFYRVRKIDQAHQRGSGLGLPVVKKLVACIQGVLQVESSEGWTAFTLELPCTK